jgi:hypothetical protein
LLRPLEFEISRRLRAAGSQVNPESHGRRLASLLLPDVLRYDPHLPVGFTFAARNGRHPLESADEMVYATLNGGKTLGSSLAHLGSPLRHFLTSNTTRRLYNAE